MVAALAYQVQTVGQQRIMCMCGHVASLVLATLLISLMPVYHLQCSGKYLDGLRPEGARVSVGEGSSQGTLSLNELCNVRPRAW